MRRCLLLVLIAAFVGCQVAREAHDVQRDVAPKADDAAALSQGDSISLRGARLPELVDFALTNRPSIVSARLAVEDARLKLREIAADAPLVSETPWNAFHLSAVGAYTENSIKNNNLKLKTDGSASAGLSLDLAVYDFGRNAAQAKAQAEYVTAAELNLIQAGYVVFYEVSEAYFGLLEAAAMLEVARTNEYEYALHYERAQNLVSEGEGVRLDLLKARYNLTAAIETRIAASNTLLTAEVEMMKALGLEVARVDLTDFDALGEGALSFAVKGFDDTTYDAEYAFLLARTNAPAMRVVRANLRAASREVDRVVADLYPNFTLTGSLNWTDPLWYWGWGVKLSQTIFQGSRKTTAIEQAVVGLKAAAANVDAEEQALSASVALSIAARDNAREALLSSRDALSRAKENLDTVMRQYHVGDASRIDCTDAVAVYVEELGNGVKAFYRGQLAEAALFSLLGEYPVYHQETKE